MQKLIIQYNSTVYRDHGGLGFLALKYHPKASLIFSYFVTSRQYRLGIAKLKKVFRSFLTNSKIYYGILKILYLVEFSTDWLTDSLTHLLPP